MKLATIKKLQKSVGIVLKQLEKISSLLNESNEISSPKTKKRGRKAKNS